MRKRLVTNPATVLGGQGEEQRWFDLEHSATVEVTSEDKDFPIESSLSNEHRKGWRAAEPGTQTIRLFFDEPQKIKRISLEFEEDEVKRTQEFVLRSAGPFRQILRQQWNFSVPSATREIEEYCVELSDVTVLELTIVPDISGGTACASLKSLRLA
jgi:hypothetical protein